MKKSHPDNFPPPVSRAIEMAERITPIPAAISRKGFEKGVKKKVMSSTARQSASARGALTYKARRGLNFRPSIIRKLSNARHHPPRIKPRYGQVSRLKATLTRGRVHAVVRRNSTPLNFNFRAFHALGIQRDTFLQYFSYDSPNFRFKVGSS